MSAAGIPGVYRARHNDGDPQRGNSDDAKAVTRGEEGLKAGILHFLEINMSLRKESGCVRAQPGSFCPG
jgi:hypothetical protein